MVALIPVIWEANIRKVTARGQPVQKVSDTLLFLSNKPGVVMHAYNPSYVGTIARRITV
jgi:hypothetical protein